MRVVPLAACLTLASAFTACGGQGSATSTATSTQAPASAPSTTTATAAGRSGAAGPARVGSTPPASAAASTGPRGHGASSFIEPSADNSIPEYGTESSSSQRAAAGADLRAYLSARARGEWGRACTYLAASSRSQLESFAKASKGKLKGCAAVLAALEVSTPASVRANPLRGPIAALRVKGKSAFALFYGPHVQQYTMPMASQAGTWKVTQIAPSPYPLGSTAPSS